MAQSIGIFIFYPLLVQSLLCPENVKLSTFNNTDKVSPDTLQAIFCPTLTTNSSMSSCTVCLINGISVRLNCANLVNHFINTKTGFAIHNQRFSTCNSVNPQFIHWQSSTNLYMRATISQNQLLIVHRAQEKCAFILGPPMVNHIVWTRCNSHSSLKIVKIPHRRDQVTFIIYDKQQPNYDRIILVQKLDSTTSTNKEGSINDSWINKEFNLTFLIVVLCLAVLAVVLSLILIRIYRKRRSSHRASIPKQKVTSVGTSPESSKYSSASTDKSSQKQNEPKFKGKKHSSGKAQENNRLTSKVETQPTPSSILSADSFFLTNPIIYKSPDRSQVRKAESITIMSAATQYESATKDPFTLTNTDTAAPKNPPPLSKRKRMNPKAEESSTQGQDA